MLRKGRRLAGNQLGTCLRATRAPDQRCSVAVLIMATPDSRGTSASSCRLGLVPINVSATKAGSTVTAATTDSQWRHDLKLPKQFSAYGDEQLLVRSRLSSRLEAGTTGDFGQFLGGGPGHRAAQLQRRGHSPGGAAGELCRSSTLIRYSSGSMMPKGPSASICTRNALCASRWDSQTY